MLTRKSVSRLMPQLHRTKRLHACSKRRSASLKELYQGKADMSGKRKRSLIPRWQGHFRKRQRLYSETLDPDQPQWDKLPDLVVVSIFSYLSLSDRARMALTCRRWAGLYHAPGLWKKASVDFCSHRLTNSELKCLYRHSQHIRSMEIILWKNFGFNNKLSLKHVPQLVKVLSCSELNDLDLGCLRVGAHGRNWPTASLTVSTLVNFLTSQKRLKTVKLSNLRIEEEEGLTILSALAAQNQMSVSTLDITSLFQKSAKLERKFVNVMSVFTNLTEFHINYSYISDDLVEGIATRCGKSLRLLTVDVHHNEPHHHTVKISSWKHFKRSCPSAQVIFSLEYINSYSEIRMILTPGIPLNTLNVWTGYDVEDDRRLPQILVDIGCNFSDHLVNACIQLDNRDTAVYHELLFLAKRCKKLASLDLTAIVELDAVKRLCKLRDENKIGLDRLHLTMADTFGENNTEQESAIEELKAICRDIIAKTGVDYQFMLS
ncbi:F-box only protein 39-like [Lineus longissimus]|uniref:F-box only protein 39-like n=1 Tax=Lineus longissimus TaxID=88925 RepID=UPI002B4EDEC4